VSAAPLPFRERDDDLSPGEVGRRYRTLIEQLPLVVYVDALDAVSSNIFTSPQIEPLLGYSVDEWKADTDLLFKITGRPLSFHQVFIGERRGGVYDGPIDAIDPAFLKALRESNIRPEWYNLAWAQRYSYPSAFVLRALTEAGDLTQAETHEILLFIGWPPPLAEKVSTRWAGGVGAAADPNVKKAQTQLWSATHRSYVAGETDEAQAQERMGALGIPAAAQLDILTLWALERQLVRKTLTPAQIKKAYAEPVENPATGQLWTREDALAALLELGYSADNAETFLEL